MKLRSTTPASIPFYAKSVLAVGVILMAFAVPIQLSNTVYARDFNAEINAIQKDIDSAQAQASAFAAQAQTLQTAVSQLQSQATAIQGQIDLSQAKYDKLVADIAETEKKIKENQDALGETIANLYVDDNITPLEMIASSKNVSEYLDKQEYRNSVRDELTSTIATIKDLKIQLDTQKVDVERVLADQKNSKNALVAKQAEQQAVLTETQGQEAAYQQLVSSNQSKQRSVQEQQQAAIEAAQARAGGNAFVLPGTSGGYPWTSANCTVDANAWSHGGSNGSGGDGIGYGCRQCTSYVAWRAYKETGYAPVNWGDAVDFPSRGAGAGFATGTSPRANSIGVITYGGRPGHVVWVESVDSANGTMIISQYNYYNAGGSGWGHYSKMQVSIGTYQSYVYM